MGSARVQDGRPAVTVLGQEGEAVTETPFEIRSDGTGHGLVMSGGNGRANGPGRLREP